MKEGVLDAGVTPGLVATSAEQSVSETHESGVLSTAADLSPAAEALESAQEDVLGQLVGSSDAPVSNDGADGVVAVVDESTLDAEADDALPSAVVPPLFSGESDTGSAPFKRRSDMRIDISAARLQRGLGAELADLVCAAISGSQGSAAQRAEARLPGLLASSLSPALLLQLQINPAYSLSMAPRFNASADVKPELFSPLVHAKVSLALCARLVLDPAVNQQSPRFPICRLAQL
jgi:hypothetical protein